MKANYTCKEMPKWPQKRTKRYRVVHAKDEDEAVCLFFSLYLCFFVSYKSKFILIWS